MVYYISKNDGKYQGPFNKDALIANGLDLDTMVWREGLPAWTPAKMLPELADIICNVPPPMEVVIGPSSATIQPVQQQPVQQPVQSQPAQQQPMQQPANEEIDKQKKLDQLNHKKEELKKVLEQRKTRKLAEVQTKNVVEKKEQKKQVETKAKKEVTKSKKKTKYDHPVADWCNESIWLLAFVIIHALIEFWSDNPNYTYLYLDVIGAVLSITGIIIGVNIKKLNKISYKKGSESRVKAEKLGYFNGLFVSATAAIGFLIVLVQSAYYVYSS